MNTTSKIAVIGLGYVGLPLARLFATKYPVVGFDIHQARVEEINQGHDSTLEVEDEILQAVLLKKYLFLTHLEHIDKNTAANSDKALHTFDDNGIQTTGLYCSHQLEDLAEANVYIVTVPTPVDQHHRPNLTPLIKASETVGKVLKAGDIVIYESTVYPGVTEEECVPILEKVSGLKFNEDFFAGYSPERINPGDKEHTVEKILKVTAGSTPEKGRKSDEWNKSGSTAGA